MDSVTQVVLGAAVAEAALGRKIGNKAIVWGAIAGTIPDLDVLVSFFVDKLSADELHRGFSHSILFSILFAPVLAWIAMRIHKKETAGFKEWTWMMFLALITHPILDAHTAWGTQLFWPLPYKITYNNIFVIDPLYTVPFMIFVIMAMRRKKSDPKRRRYNNIGLIVSSSYMLLTFGFKGIAHYQFTKNLEEQHIAYQELEAKPMPLNSILWCGFVKSGDEILLGYYSLFDGGGPITFTHFKQNKELLGDLKDNEIIHRMDKLARGWYVIEQRGDTIFFDDVRFGQAGFSNDPSSFVFSRMITRDGDKLKVGVRDPKFRSEDFGNLFKRIVSK